MSGLAWPAHDVGPTPPPEYVSRARDEERRTRKTMALWDRTKWLVLMVIVFLFLLANTLNQFEGIITLADGLRFTLQESAWLWVLAGAEVIRQVHYLISEHWSGYHLFWTRKVFGAFNRRMERMNDWNRFRLGRAAKWFVVLVILDLIIAQVTGLPAWTAILQAPVLLFQALPLIFQLAFAAFFLIFQFAALFYFLSKGGVQTYFPDDIKTRFTDVWGQDNVLKKVKENMVFLEDPESIEKRGGYVPGGILLWGPPGTGKTLMAEAVAGETGRPFMFIEPGAFTNMFMGVGILKVKALFRKARKMALRYGGIIMFFDEADALGSRQAKSGPEGGFRQAPGGNGLPWEQLSACNGLAYQDDRSRALLVGSQRDGIIMGGMGAGGGGGGTLQSLLTEMSGLKKPRGFFNRILRRALGMRPKPPPKYRILIMMASNLPEALDDALLRPGRIDRIYKVGYPSKSGRIRTYQGYFDKVTHQLTEAELDRLATITPYATGATMKDLVNEALINAIRDGREVIGWHDVIKAKQLKELGPPEDVEYIERERHAVAVHEACHAVAAYRVRKHLLIDIATIEKGGTYLGMVASIPPEDLFVTWRSEYESSIIVSLASLAGERMFFEYDNSSGVSGDLMSATHIATMMEGYWGMGSTITSHRVAKEHGIGGGGGRKGDGPDDQQDLLKDIALGARIEDKLADLYQRTVDLLTENRAHVLAVAHALETHKTITGEDVTAIIEGHAGPLVDGRPYHTEEFQDLAEAYHLRVVEAHRGHAKVDAPLPRLPQPVAVGAGAGWAAPDGGWGVTAPPPTAWGPPNGQGNGHGNGSGNGSGHGSHGPLPPPPPKPPAD